MPLLMFSYLYWGVVQKLAWDVYSGRWLVK